jgi:diguanylate cyclase (GGDEF)-like protein
MPAAFKRCCPFVDSNVMRLRDIRASTRFFITLGVVLASLAALAALGLTGLAAVDGANRQVFRDNFTTAEATSRLATDLAQAEILSLRLIDARNEPTVEVLRARLDEIVIPGISESLTNLLRLHAHDPPAEHAQVEHIPAGWQAFLPLTRRAPFVSGSALLDAPARSAAAGEVEQHLDPLIAFVSARQSIEVDAAERAQASAQHTYEVNRIWLILVALISLLAAATMIRVGLTLKRLLADQAEQQDHGDLANEYTGTLQATGNEADAQELLRRQVERIQPGTRAVVLGRNNSADRLEARTSLEALDELRERLEPATPRSCLAVRFARTHTEGGSRAALTSCELCGALAGSSTCEPLLVGGEVIGSVLVTGAEPPDHRSGQRIREAVAQAAPVLGNLRNLAIAELRAATDRLTGLPNQRAVQDTLKRMVAQASRTITPLTAVLVDLDHFKEINDVYGHDRGDEVLATVGVAMRNAMRDSDFVGRYGGEEFLLLLPATDTEGAVQVAEAVRGAISAIHVSAVRQRITASAGVATLPRDAGDSVTLFRAADRALYAAKNAGRDRVHVVTDQLQPPTETGFSAERGPGQLAPEAEGAK